MLGIVIVVLGTCLLSGSLDPEGKNIETHQTLPCGTSPPDHISNFLGNVVRSDSGAIENLAAMVQERTATPYDS